MNDLNKLKGRISESNRIRFRTFDNGINGNLDINAHKSRKDVYGNIISKKIKQHKISFADQIENTRNFVETKQVVSYKLYNQSQDYQGR